jgi:hypothetical protein
MGKWEIPEHEPDKLHGYAAVGRNPHGVSTIGGEIRDGCERFLLRIDTYVHFYLSGPYRAHNGVYSAAEWAEGDEKRFKDIFAQTIREGWGDSSTLGAPASRSALACGTTATSPARSKRSSRAVTPPMGKARATNNVAPRATSRGATRG